MAPVIDTEKWIWLAEALRPGNRISSAVLEYFGTPGGAYLSGENEFRLVPARLTERDISALCNKSLDRARKILSECEKKNIRVITRHSREFPERLKEIPCAPLILYARGAVLETDFDAAVAIVGTRSCTSQGAEAARKIGREISELGGVVVSGLAKGIDSFGAEGALSVGGDCIGVLGCGVDVAYPRENLQLIETVAMCGTLISEFPPGTPPYKGNFPLRNRILSGLSLGTVIVEAPERSGAMITAQYALEQDRDLFAVPSGIAGKAISGTNRLIRDGAIPVTSGKEIISEYSGVSGIFLRKPKKDKPAVKPTKPEAVKPKEEKVIQPTRVIPEKKSDSETVTTGMSPEHKAIVTALREKELEPDEISRITGIPMSGVLSALTLLEIRGKVARSSGNKFRIKF